MKFGISFLIASTLSAVVQGACPNLCSGHGSCGVNGEREEKKEAELLCKSLILKPT